MAPNEEGGSPILQRYNKVSNNGRVVARSRARARSRPGPRSLLMFWSQFANHERGPSRGSMPRGARRPPPLLSYSLAQLDQVPAFVWGGIDPITRYKGSEQTTDGYHSVRGQSNPSNLLRPRPDIIEESGQFSGRVGGAGSREGMLDPKSPLDTLSTPSKAGSLQSDEPTTNPLSPNKYGVKSGQAPLSKAKDIMPHSPTAAQALSTANNADRGRGQENEGSIPHPESIPSSASDPTSVGREQMHSQVQVDQEKSPSTGDHNRGPPSRSSAAGEVERLRAAMNAQIQLNQQRERLARQLGERDGRDNHSPVTGTGRTRVSPIHEEAVSPSLDASFASPLTSTMDTTSTESTDTLRGGTTPAAVDVRTPSYPFPHMRPPRQTTYTGHRPFTALSPTVTPENFAGGSSEEAPQDYVVSGSVTPASSLNFHPPGLSQTEEPSTFETPNLYDLSLMLSAEPGLDPWWTTVVQLMREIYQADRVTLSIPADSTDMENVPWGQKATFNAVEDDELSLTYLPRGSSFVPSSVGTNEISNFEETNVEGNSPPPYVPAPNTVRPGLLSRHSFTAYENTKREPAMTSESNRGLATRPTPLVRAKSYLSTRLDKAPRAGTLQNAQLNLQSLQDHLAFEEANHSNNWENAEATARDVHGQVFPVLQALDYEADPLIDSSGVLRVLNRGRVIVLTRDYPYLNDPADEKSGGSKGSQQSTKSKDTTEKHKKTKPPEVGSRISSLLGGQSSRRTSRSARSQTSDKSKSASLRAFEDDDEDVPQPPQYEEYEQAPPSPWVQSPAPSPAVQAETAENPFFANAVVNEEIFNPDAAIPDDFSKIKQVEAIGIDRSCTVLHIPLIHPLLSKPVQSFRLDAAAMESRSAGRGKGSDPRPKKTNASNPQVTEQAKEKRTPIAILSIISPVIPYPSSLRHSLEHLSPHLATSFSLCRHYSNLETEVAGLSRRRPQTTGFGAVAPGGRPIEDRHTLGPFVYSPVDESAPQQLNAGSITSPSDYSGLSRSNAGSPIGTPGWDPSSVGLSLDKRSSGGSPGFVIGEGYFSSRKRPSLGRVDTGSASSVTGVRSVKDGSPAERRHHPRRSTGEKSPDVEIPGPERSEAIGKAITPQDDVSSSQRLERPCQPSRDLSIDTAEPQDLISSSRPQVETPFSPRRQALRTASNQAPTKQHTLLHSYGAEYGSTFQSLPTTSTPSTTTKTPTALKPQSRAPGSMSIPTDMPPPSDRLKGLMLDSLPAHVFVALPQTGEIVWVNSRYLTYRGQTVSELYQDPWGSIHPDEREEYLKAWSHALRTGEQFSMQVRIKRFDGTYRWFYTRAVGSRDIRGVIVQWYGSHMDIHDQHIAEVKAARQEEIEASEAKHRQLANLIPQIIFAATEDEGVTFANEQWLSYTGQEFSDALGLGFMDYVHPDDLARCQVPVSRPHTPVDLPKKPHEPSRNSPEASVDRISSAKSSNIFGAPIESAIKGTHKSLSRNNSSSTGSVYEMATADLSELARNGVIKVSTDSNGRVSYTTEMRLRTKSGEYRWHLVRCVEVDNINLGSGDGSWFGACTDINDHKLLETKLKEAMESKGKFLSNMSHEIRTPLIGISGMVSFLQDTVLNDEQIDYTNTIQSSASSLLNIINDILDLSKVDAGMMKLSYEWFHTRSLVEEVNEMVSTMAITKRLELNYVVDIDVPEMVKGDKFRIRQVLLNVIGNAIKFTTVGEVFSRCKVYSGNSARVGDNEVMLEYSIVDTGRGFTEEEADLIFKPFSQIDGSSTRQHGGSGLGLVISRQLVELHGGRMEGSAIPGKGSTFTFTVKFGLPTVEDCPEPPLTPMSTGPSTRSSIRSSTSTDISARAMKQAGGNPILANKFMQSPQIDSPRTGSSIESASSDTSLHSNRSHITQRPSGSPMAQNLAHFGEAARASALDMSRMKLALPDRHSSSPEPILTHGELISPTTNSTKFHQRQSNIDPGDALSRQGSGSLSDLKHFRPPMYSILLICPQTHSREATTKHIENTLPKDFPHQIIPLSSVEEAQQLISGDDPVIFTHIVLNLGTAEDIVALIDQIIMSISLPQTSIVVLSDPVQRQEVIKMATAYNYDQLAKDNRVTFVYKPVKPSRFAVIFDPDKERDLSTDRNRSSAQQQVANQKQNYLDVGKRLGNKGLKVLLVEDNLVNQKVLLKFLSKVGIAVELALDGVECTEKVFSQPHSFYSLILCDLHMPRKDGYQTCREIREWEQKESYPRMPIIALSANVMADVLDKCVKAGFNSYVTKPVDFKALSTAMSNFLDPHAPADGTKLLKQNILPIMSERRPSRTGPTAGRRMPTRSQPSPGGLQEMPLNPPPRKRGTKRKGTQDTLDTAMAASATASSEEPTSATEQTTIPSISRSQSPHDTDSRSQATPAAESRSISPPAVTGNGTRPESRDISPTPAPALYTRRKIRTQQVVTQPKSKSAASAGSKRSRDDNDSSNGKSADIQEAITAGEDRPAKRARHGGSPLIDPTILPNVSGEESPVQSAGPSKKKAAMTYPSKQSPAPLRPGVKPQVPRRNNPIHEAGKEAYDDGYESISEPEEPMTLGELKELKRNGFKLNFEPRTNMVAKINRATRPSMNNLESSSAANFSSAASSTAHPLSSQSKILLPAHLSKKERILTNPDLVAATHRFADWVEANPSRAIPSADEMEGLLEYFHTQQQADKSSIATIQNDEPNHKIQEGINKERPPVPQGGSSEGVSEAHESQTPATQQTTGGWNTWSGITTLFATPFKFTRDQAPTPTAVTTNAHPVTDIAVFSSLSSVPATPTPAGPRPRPGAHNNHRARQSSGHSQNRNSVRRRREEPKKLPIEQRGLLSQEEIAERHRLQDLENEKAMSKQRNERRASYVARAELEENEISLRAIDTPKLRHRRPEEGDEFTWNGLERVVSGGRLKRKRDWVKPSGTYGLPRPEEVEEKSDDEKDPMIEDLPHLMVDEFEDLSVEVSSLAHNQQNSNAGGVPRISYGPDGTVLGDPHHARPYTGTLFQQPPDVQANIDEGRFPLTPRQNIQIFNPFSPPANLNCLPPEPHNVPGSPPKSILRSPGKIDRRVSRAAAFLRRPKLDFGNIPQINPSETSNAGVVADAPQINPSKTSDANVVADAPQLDPAPVERAPPVSDTGAPPISNTPTPQVDPTSIMLGNYRVERAPPVSDTGAPPPISNTPTPQVDPTSIMLGNYRVERAPPVLCHTGLAPLLSLYG
ncbi:hypothetical protein B7494_g5452 [Chlorociboria aeruginascens]|nr:hypothetical protein B7494_g5452 [Chlorociboria aeruginascens]